jgi:hypothetical protein
MNFTLNGRVVSVTTRFSARICMDVIDVAVDGEHAGCRGTMADALALATIATAPMPPASVIDALRGVSL